MASAVVPLPAEDASLDDRAMSHSAVLSPERGRGARMIGSAGASLLVHALMILLMGAVSWGVGREAEPIPTEFKAEIAPEPKKDIGGGFRFPGKAMIDRPNEADGSKELDSIQDLASMMEHVDPLGLSEDQNEDSGLGAISVAGLGRGDVVGVGTGRGTGRGGKGFGRRALAGGGPVGALWGVGEGRKANSIVYVLDRSGSMSDTFESLRSELLRTVGSLAEDQMFNIIWFSDGPATEFSPRMAPATIENKRKAFDAVRRIVPKGQTEPVDAIRRGFNHQPDVIYLLSDGAFGEENDNVIRLIREKNRNKQTVVNTILFVEDTGGDGERVLRAIAEENGGSYKHVTEKELR